jgi:exopolysaccharide biosynthesis polyprenyl glycosylphosphotransferase
MNPFIKIRALARIPVLIFGDIAIFYASLFIALSIRYGLTPLSYVADHVIPFSIGLLLWILISYISGLYERASLKNTSSFYATFFISLIIETLTLITLFYLTPSFGIAPKANLAIFVGVFLVLEIIWRSILNSILVARGSRIRLMFLGNSHNMTEIKDHLAHNPQLGYELVAWYSDEPTRQTSDELLREINAKQIHLVVVSAQLEKTKAFKDFAYKNAVSGVPLIDLAVLYEQIFSRVSLAELEESWSLKDLTNEARLYQSVKRILELLWVLVIGIITLPFAIITALAIFLTSRGPIFYKQRRVGKRKQLFWLYKFRSMYAEKEKNPDADASKPIWTSGKDQRITPVGKFIRFTHLDELPQLINILKGEMSFIGPRPERPEFDKDLEQKIPYYELRYLAKPGITGWAQINYRYGASVEDAYAKLQYDLYYLAHRSLLLDISILLKTIKKIFVQVD